MHRWGKDFEFVSNPNRDLIVSYLCPWEGSRLSIQMRVNSTCLLHYILITMILIFLPPRFSSFIVLKSLPKPRCVGMRSRLVLSFSPPEDNVLEVILISFPEPTLQPLARFLMAISLLSSVVVFRCILWIESSVLLLLPILLLCYWSCTVTPHADAILMSSGLHAVPASVLLSIFHDDFTIWEKMRVVLRLDSLIQRTACALAQRSWGRSCVWLRSKYSTCHPTENI